LVFLVLCFDYGGAEELVVAAVSACHGDLGPRLLVLAGAAIRLRGNADVGMIILTGLFTLITAPVVANRVGQLAYREQNIRDDLLTRDEMLEFAEEREPGTNGQD